MSKQLTLTCYGGAGGVTGANFLLEGIPGKFLIDCGLLQGKKFAEQENARAFDYDPASITALVVTHAHLDHIGRIPKLVRDGFKGTIYSTLPTKDIVPLMFADALSVMRAEQDPGETLLYEEKDIEATLSLWRGLPYREPVDLGSGLSLQFKDAGHILGSAMAEFSYGAGKLLATGDLGNSPSLLLPDTESPAGITYLLMESVYGDRNHEPKDARDSRFKEALEETIARGGTAVIPAFSLERTQDILFVLNNLIESGALPSVPVYLDSPLAIKVTGVYKQYTSYFKSSVAERIRGGDDIFNFPKLKLSESGRDSAHIHARPGPKIILAGSGMSAGGRVKRHEAEYLPDEKNAVILVGYQSLFTLGRQLEEGAREVTIEGARVPVRARIVPIRGFSSHKDLDHLVEFVGQAAPTLKNVFVAMGEPKASMFLAQRLRDYLGVHASVTEANASYTLEF